MTEAEWLSCDHPILLMRELDGAFSARKFRLLRGRTMQRHAGTDLQCSAAVEVYERFADGEATEEQLERAREVLRSVGGTCASIVARGLVPDGTPVSRAAWDGYLARAAQRGEAPPANPEQCALIRDIFGNPFRRVTFSPEWRTDTAVALARQMYESRDFGAMPILADALQEAGCDNEDILAHCRGPGPHVRGCWVVDLVLGKG